MSSKIVFKINGNKDLSQISAPNVIAQLDNLKRNINQGVQYLAKKKSTVGRYISSLAESKLVLVFKIG